MEHKALSALYIALQVEGFWVMLRAGERASVQVKCVNFVI
jgi:hypothetical protein